MYTQVFFFGPLHKKTRHTEAKPPSEVFFSDDSGKHIYHLWMSLNNGHKLVYRLQGEDGKAVDIPDHE